MIAATTVFNFQHTEQLYSWPLPALNHWEAEVGGTSMEEVRGQALLGGLMFITISARD